MKEAPRPVGSPIAKDAGGGNDGASIPAVGQRRQKSRRALLAGAAAGVAGIVGENTLGAAESCREWRSGSSPGRLQSRHDDDGDQLYRVSDGAKAR